MEKTKAGISNQELATEIREMTSLLNRLLEDAKGKGLEVEVSINSHFKNIKTISIGKITQSL